jgi:hypothetical protein
MNGLSGSAVVKTREGLGGKLDVVVDYTERPLEKTIVNIEFSKDVKNIANLKVEGRFTNSIGSFFEIFCFAEDITIVPDLENRCTIFNIKIGSLPTNKTITIFTRTLPESEQEMETGKTEATGIISVHRIYKDGGVVINEEVGEELVEVPSVQPGALMGRIGYSNRYTVNLENYESAQIGVSIELPCYISQEEINEAFQSARAFVDSRLNKEVNEVKDFVANRKKK